MGTSKILDEAQAAVRRAQLTTVERKKQLKKEAQESLARACARGDKASAQYWERILLGMNGGKTR